MSLALAGTQAALDNGVAGILGDYGGSCSYATCHGYVDERWLSKLLPRSETEVFMLEGVPQPRETSRLKVGTRQRLVPTNLSDSRLCGLDKNFGNLLWAIDHHRVTTRPD